MPAIVAIIALLALGGTIALIAVSARLRGEMDDLFRAFDRTQRTLTPLVATVRTDRDRLQERLARLSETRSGTTGEHR